MKSNLVFRNALVSDVDNLNHLENKVWGTEMSADNKKWLSRINHFSEGIFIAERDDLLIGVIVGHLIKWNYPENYYPNWFEVSDDGYLNNHCTEGNILYGVDFSVLPGSPGIASCLMTMMIDFMRNLEGVTGMMGCRIPTLRRYADKYGITNIDDDLVLQHAKRDPEVKFFLRHGFMIKAAKQNYFEPDYESIGWGVILEIK